MRSGAIRVEQTGRQECPPHQKAHPPDRPSGSPRGRELGVRAAPPMSPAGRQGGSSWRLWARQRDSAGDALDEADRLRWPRHGGDLTLQAARGLLIGRLM